MSNLEQFLKELRAQMDSGPKRTIARDGYVDPQERWSTEFDKLLLSTIDETIRYVMGDGNASIIFQHIKDNYCLKENIPKNLKVFSYALRDLIGISRRQMRGAACILEETIAETLVKKIGKKFEAETPLNFASYIQDIKQAYIQENRLR